MVNSDRTIDVAEKSFLIKPEDYEETCSIVRHLPYQCEGERFKGTPMTGGVLAKGRIVWVQRFHEGKKPSRRRHIAYLAYVDGIGIVSVDPRYLVRDGRSQSAA